MAGTSPHHLDAGTLCRGLQQVVAGNLATLRLFCRSMPYLLPMLIIWLASFGGALHAPVTTFFYLKLGASAADVGTSGMLSSLGGLLLAPIYGWMLDSRGPYLAIFLSSFFCGLGCLIQGLATSVRMLYVARFVLGLGAGNLWVIVLAYVSRISPTATRADIVSGYLFQVTACRIAGKSLYPLFHALVYACGVRDELVNDRITMSVCTVFCFLGVGLLLVFGHHIRKAVAVVGGSPLDGAATAPTTTSAAAAALLGPNHPPTAAASPPLSPSYSLDIERRRPSPPMPSLSAPFPIATTTSTTTPSTTSHPSSSVGVAVPVEVLEDGASGLAGGALHRVSAAQERQRRVLFVLVALALVVQVVSATAAYVLWPLFLHDEFGFDARDFAPLLFVSSLLATLAVSAVPTVERYLGRYPTAVAAALVAAVTGGMAFRFAQPDALAHMAHFVLVTIFQAAVAFLEPSLKAIASRYLPQSQQGSAFGWMASLSGLGEIVGNMGGTRLYSKGQPGQPSQLPFLAVSLLLLLASALLTLANRLEIQAGIHIAAPMAMGKESPQLPHVSLPGVVVAKTTAAAASDPSISARLPHHLDR